MIITVGNTKGGVGKTTLAVNLAIARALTGRDVWLIDGDRQGTAQAAISIRAEAGHTPGIACATYPDGPTLRAQVQQQASKFDEVIIDAGGRDSTALRAALVLSDVLLVPFQPRSYEPPRDCRRLQSLREWSHENQQEIQRRGSGAGGSVSSGAAGGLFLTLGSP